jgi:ferric-dicitrate binding protein FerR (iron transport regulator)
LDKKKLHINGSGNNYPEPDIPVDDAWNNMQQLLQQAPAAPASKSVLAKGKLLSKIIAATGGVVIVSSVIYMIAIQKEGTETPKQVQQTTEVTPQRDTLADGSIAYLDYANKVFEFTNMPFSKAAAYIEKVYSVKFIIKNNKLDNCTITTRFDNRSLEEVLDVIGYTLAFEYEIDKTKNQVIISGDGCN